MAYSEELAERIREVVDGRPGVLERKMFGGIAWMVNGNMACGIVGEDLMVRLERDEADAAQTEEHVGPMDLTGRSMHGCPTGRSVRVFESLPSTVYSATFGQAKRSPQFRSSSSSAEANRTTASSGNRASSTSTRNS